MKNKKTIMAVSALLILIYHLWINVFNSIIEINLRQLCVIGVDLFFFISAYSISKKEKINYKQFIFNRFNNIYFKFLIFAIIAAIYFSWNFKKFTLTILGVDLFLNGGGSFLWFLPGIMILYVLVPFFKKLDEKYSLITVFISFILFILLSISVSIFTNYKEIFILTNRFLIFFIGYYFGKYKVIENIEKSKLKYWLLTFALLIIGFVISYYGISNKVKFIWFYDVIYILNIPFEIGLLLLLNKIKENKLSNIIGNCTLELYGFQMIFGFKLANKLYMQFNNSLICNLFVIVFLIFSSYLFKMVFDLKDICLHKLNRTFNN